MKKVFVACAVVAAMALTSCGDTQKCYEISTTVTIHGVETTTVSYVYGTSNDLDLAVANIKKVESLAGVPEDAVKIKYHSVPKSQEDCRK